MPTVFDSIVISLLICNVLWILFTLRFRWAVPGSHTQAEYRARCRYVRWPGALFWPAYTIHLLTLFPADSTFIRFLVLLFLWLSIYWARRDYYELRRQISEDDDDFWNKTRRAWKRAKRAVASALVLPPVSAPVSA